MPQATGSRQARRTEVGTGGAESVYMTAPERGKPASDAVRNRWGIGNAAAVRCRGAVEALSAVAPRAGAAPGAGRLERPGEPGTSGLAQQLLVPEVDEVLVGVGHGDGSFLCGGVWGAWGCGGGNRRAPAAAGPVRGRARSRPRRSLSRCRPGRRARWW